MYKAKDGQMKSRPPILGVDFDETLFLNSFPYNYSEPNWHVINYIKAKKNSGWHIILVTCRTQQEYIDGALKACSDVGIEFDAVNENHPDLIAEFGDCRKIFCDEYIDDKNVTLRDIEPTQISITIPNQPVVYISGKMRGLPDLGKSRFTSAAEYLRAKGYTVIDPSIIPVGLKEYDYMPICLAMIDAADIIFMLDNWQDSVGAEVEYKYAVCQGKSVMFESDTQLKKNT